MATVFTDFLNPNAGSCTLRTLQLLFWLLTPTSTFKTCFVELPGTQAYASWLVWQCLLMADPQLSWLQLPLCLYDRPQPWRAWEWTGKSCS